MLFIFFFFFNDTATTEIYTLSLHDALPISWDHHPDRASTSRQNRRPRGVKRLVRSRQRHTCARHHPVTLSSRQGDRKSTRLNSSHANISYAVFCLKKKTHEITSPDRNCC